MDAEEAGVLSSELAPHHFYHILSVIAGLQASPGLVNNYSLLENTLPQKEVAQLPPGADGGPGILAVFT